ncbi:MAG: hypothetical protein ACLTS6_15945 [Anaerobutyricum sp.]
MAMSLPQAVKDGYLVDFHVCGDHTRNSLSMELYMMSCLKKTRKHYEDTFEDENGKCRTAIGASAALNDMDI